jgi:DNA-binding NtrC family response regulator
MQKHILAIDDEPDIRNLLRDTLSLEGYRVTTASTGEEARRIVQADPPNLVISDLQMEDTDGLVLAGELRKISPDMPILLLTGVVFDHDVIREIVQKQVSSYLDKTTPLSGILNEVKRLLKDKE